MAHIVDNPYLAEFPQRAGLLFELKVLDELKTGLSDDFYVTHNTVLTQRGEYDRGLGREVDFIVVGPSGVFVIEAKFKDSVEGDLFGPWTYRRLHKGRVSAQNTSDKGPCEILKCKIQEVSQILKLDTMPKICREWKPHAIRGVFVFPDESDIKIYSGNHGRRPETRFRSEQYFITRLSTIAETLSELRPVRGVAELSPKQAQTVTNHFKPRRYMEPKIAGDYEIIETLSTHRALNGLRYTLYKLKHRFSNYYRLGKLYDIAPLMHKNKDFFMEQINRHANTLNELKDHENVLRFTELKVDEMRDGVWALMEWVDADPLENFLDAASHDERILKKIVYEVAVALKHLHGKKMVRRTLGPDAIMIERDTNRALLTNFELTKQLEGAKTIFEDDGNVKTDPYSAPELEVNPHNGDVRLDVYAWGALAYRVFEGKAPNEACRNGEVNFEKNIPNNIAKCIAECLSLSASDRPKSMKAITKVIAPWGKL